MRKLKPPYGPVHQHLLAAAVMAVAMMVTGCSSADSKIYEGYKCGKVAEMLGRSSDAVAAAEKIKPLLSEKTGNASQYMLALMAKFTDDMELYRLSPRGQFEKIKDTYESRTCQKLYH